MHKGRRSVYLSLAVPASDGRSGIIKRNVVNSDLLQQVDRKRRAAERRSSKSYVQERCLLC